MVPAYHMCVALNREGVSSENSGIESGYGCDEGNGKTKTIKGAIRRCVLQTLYKYR